MSEPFSEKRYEGGGEGEPALDYRAIFDRLARLNHELDWGLDESIIEDLGGIDDGDLLGNLVGFVYQYDIDIDPDEFLRLLGIDLEQGVEDRSEME